MNSNHSILCCALGAIVIGFFANQLRTPIGAFCFAVGVLLLCIGTFSFVKKTMK